MAKIRASQVKLAHHGGLHENIALLEVSAMCGLVTEGALDTGATLMRRLRAVRSKNQRAQRQRCTPYAADQSNYPVVYIYVYA